MADTIRINDKALQRLLKRAAKKGTNLKVWFKGPLDKSVSSLLKRHFDSRGAFTGNPWAPLRPATKASRLTKRGGNRGGIGHPLWDTGRLRGSLLRPSHPESIRVITDTGYERGTSVPYARWHHGGFKVRQWGGHAFRRPRTVPARVLIPDPPGFVTRSWEKSLARFIDEGLDKR